VPAHLEAGEAVVATAALEAGIPRLLARLHAPEEGLDDPFHPQHDILQHLAMDPGVCGHGFLDARQLRLLLVVAHRDTAHAPGVPPFLKGRVVAVTTEQERAVKRPLVFERGHELVPVALAEALLFHTDPFCLIVRKLEGV
jgi:hypothetical protein